MVKSIIFIQNSCINLNNSLLLFIDLDVFSMNEDNLVKYYNKFNEDKRFNSRGGLVEYKVSLKYIYEYLSEFENPKILDIGAGTGAYSIKLAEDGYDVTAVELVKHNLRYIEKCKKVRAYQGNAIDLSRFSDNTFDLVLLFGPMYHLISDTDKIKALAEAKRVTKHNGIIMVAYIMNDYAVIMHGFKDNNIMDSINNNLVDDSYHVRPKDNDLYSYVRLDDINNYNAKVKLERIKIITPDGPTNYIRPVINKMDDDVFNRYIDYVIAICEKEEMLGASAHTVDILRKI